MTVFRALVPFVCIEYSSTCQRIQLVGLEWVLTRPTCMLGQSTAKQVYNLLVHKGGEPVQDPLMVTPSPVHVLYLMPFK